MIDREREQSKANECDVYGGEGERRREFNSRNSENMNDVSRLDLLLPNSVDLFLDGFFFFSLVVASGVRLAF